MQPEDPYVKRIRLAQRMLNRGRLRNFGPQGRKEFIMAALNDLERSENRKIMEAVDTICYCLSKKIDLESYVNTMVKEHGFSPSDSLSLLDKYSQNILFLFRCREINIMDYHQLVSEGKKLGLTQEEITMEFYKYIAEGGFNAKLSKSRSISALKAVGY